jgi:excisionase family DNA binding protein
VTRPYPLTIPEVAKRANVSVDTIRRAIRRGELRAWRRGPRLLRVLDVDLDAWLMDREGANT